MTVKSVVLALLGILVTHLFIHYTSGPVAFSGNFGREGLPMVALMTFLIFLAGLCGLQYLTRWRILSQGELIFIAAASVISVPMALQGFWRRSLSAITTATSKANWERYDVVPWNIRPVARRRTTRRHLAGRIARRCFNRAGRPFARPTGARHSFA